VTGDDEPAARDHLRGLAAEAPAATAGGLSLSLPYVPGRLVIEISDPSAGAGQIAESVTGQLALVEDLPRQTGRRS
jgi:hypothetical protein